MIPVLALFLALCILPSVSAALFSDTLSQKEKTRWWKTALAVFLTLIVMLQLIYWTVVDDGGLLGLLLVIYASLLSVPTALVVFFTAPRPRRILGLAAALAIPFSLFFTLWIAEEFSPTSVARKDGIVLAQEIEQYKDDTGSYPAQLHDLVPNYRTNIKDPKTYKGWLYAATNQNFMLGYVDYIDKWGYTVCLISSGIKEWNCSTDYKSPFNLAPTPTP